MFDKNKFFFHSKYFNKRGGVIFFLKKIKLGGALK